MLCIIEDINKKPLGVIFQRDISKEGNIFNLEEFNKLDTPTGYTIYSSKELYGCTAFMNFYGFDINYNDKKEALSINSVNNSYEVENAHRISIESYPEFKNIFK